MLDVTDGQPRWLTRIERTGEATVRSWLDLHSDARTESRVSVGAGESLELVATLLASREWACEDEESSFEVRRPVHHHGDALGGFFLGGVEDEEPLTVVRNGVAGSGPG